MLNFGKCGQTPEYKKARCSSRFQTLFRIIRFHTISCIPFTISKMNSCVLFSHRTETHSRLIRINCLLLTPRFRNGNGVYLDNLVQSQNLSASLKNGRQLNIRYIHSRTAKLSSTDTFRKSTWMDWECLLKLLISVAEMSYQFKM